MGGPGRNEPCPCGSGLKYKRCCELGFTTEDELAVSRALSRVMIESPPRELDTLERRFFGPIGRYGASRNDLLRYTQWLYFDARASDGTRFADTILSTCPLKRGERSFLHMMRDTAMRLYQPVSLSRPLARLRDLLSGEEVSVNAAGLPTTFNRTKLLLARVIPRSTAGWPELADACVEFPGSARDELLTALRTGMDAFRAANPRAPASDADKLAPVILREKWAQMSNWSGAPPDGQEAALRREAELRLQSQYVGWLDSPSDLLGGQSPRAAAADASQRPRVVELLRELDQKYEHALVTDAPAFEPSLFWEELGLREEREGPREQRQHGLDAIVRSLTHIDEIASMIAEKFRRQPEHDLERTIRREVLTEEPLFRQFVALLFKNATEKNQDLDMFNWHLKRIEDLVWLLVNFELHLRKVFKVDEALSWALGTTSIEDELAGELRLPFASFALVFTDRYALGLAERSLARGDSPLRGKLLRVLTAHVTELRLPGPRRVLHVSFIADAQTQQDPFIFGCNLVLDPEARLVDVLVEAAPGEDDAEFSPLFACVPQRHLLHLVVNAIMHATICRPTREAAPPVREGLRFEPSGRLVSDEVWYLPGDIEISVLRKIQQARLGAVDREQIHRCMVRGYRRRANPDWKDQNTRFIKPHWRGPSEASVVERPYRLIP